jgi:hypothetical protein
MSTRRKSENRAAAVSTVLTTFLWATTASAATTVDCTKNPGALASALTAAAPGDMLQIEGTCRGTYTIERSVTLSGMSNAVVDGNGYGPVLTIVAGIHVVLENLIVTGGASLAPVAVGGIVNNGDLQINRSKVMGNRATGVSLATGGIVSGPLATASLSLDQSEVVDNSATAVSTSSASVTGGIRTEGSVTLSRSEVRNNRAFASTQALNRAFGGMVIGAGPGYLVGTTVSDNVARSEHTGLTGAGLVAGAIGGVTHLPGNDQLVIANSIIRGNRASAVSAVGSGAAGGMVNRFTMITGTQVVGNIAEAGTFAAAGIANHNAALVLEKSTIKQNIATATEANGLAAGGIATGYLGVASTTLNKSSVVENLAYGDDAVGGLYLVNPTGSYVFDGSLVDRNMPVDCNFLGCQP